MSRSAFISYARKDELEVISLRSKLEQLGYNVWHDYQIPGGSEWWELILNNIRKADIFIIAVSAYSIGSLPCQKEREYALSLKKSLLPVRVDKAIQPASFPPELRSLQVINFFHADKQEVDLLDHAMNNMPPAASLPQPLPEPPAIPLSPISELLDQVTSPDALSEEDQAFLLYQIRKEAARTENKHEIIKLLERFKDRDDLLGAVTHEVNELMDFYNGLYVMLKNKGAAFESDKSEFIDAAEREIWFVGATMHYTARNRRETILNKLKEGVSIRALVLDKEGKMFDANAAQFGQPPDELMDEANMTIKGFQRLHQEWSAYLESSENASTAILDVRVLDEVFSTGMYLFDPDHGNSSMVVIPHIIGHDATEVPGLLFGHANEKYIKLYAQKVRTAWESGRSIFEQV